MKSKKRWFVTALTACLTLSLGICAEALEYDFDGVEDTEYYPSTSYESLYGAKYNYGGSNATDYQWPALPYGVSSRMYGKGSISWLGRLYRGKRYRE